MNENGRGFEIPKEMRSMAEAGFEQARRTFEKFLSSAQETAGTFEERGATVRAGAKDIGPEVRKTGEELRYFLRTASVWTENLGVMLKTNEPLIQSVLTSLRGTLDQTAKLLNDLVIASGTTVEIHGHTDNQGSPDANMPRRRLSYQTL